MDEKQHQEWKKDLEELHKVKAENERLRLLEQGAKIVKGLVGKQAEDETLWAEAMPLPNIAESYLQQELRKLHECIEINLSKP